MWDLDGILASTAEIPCGSWSMIDLSGRVAIITGAGRGLGREHALLLARLGARVIVNDVGGDVRGNVSVQETAAQSVVAQIEAGGGEALADTASVTDFEQVQAMVSATLARWGRVDILVNNAGILRDKSFAKMSIEDFRAVLDVHLMGAVHCTKAVWDLMRAQGYGRIVMTTSSSGLYGNFGQSNYSAAKLAVVGLMKTLALEGAKHDIRVNCIAPAAATRMLDGLFPPERLAMLNPAAVSPGVAVLVGEGAPTGMIMCAGGGSFEAAHVTLTPGVFLGAGGEVADELASRLSEVSARAGEIVPASGFDQVELELHKARGA
jgi:NAD(P)-dependent dehydrogenase (short-subunit alcohol dehydrogenase family)